MGGLDQAGIIALIGADTAPGAILALLGVSQSLVLVEDGLWPDALARCVAGAAAADGRVRVLASTLQPEAPRLVFEALALCAGPFVAVLDRGCVFADGVLPALDADIVFGDEGGGEDGAAPFYKPAWSIDLALEQDLVGALGVFRRGMLEAIGDAPLGPPHDLALRCAHLAARIEHVPEVLAMRVWPGRAQWGQVQPGRGVIGAALERLATPRTVPESVESTLQAGQSRTRWRGAATVSVIIPIRDQPDLLARCIEGVLQRTAFPVHQVIIADNDSALPETAALLARLCKDERVMVLPVPGPFNYAAINNAAAAVATGEVLVLLNSDVEVLEPGWLDEMVGHALRPDVGAVGAKLLYADGTVQHAGIVLGVGAFEGGPGVAGHFGLGQRGDAPGYAGQLVTTREVSAVTGACLAVRRDVWDRSGGMDAEHLAVALNDLDLCLRLRAMGLRIVWTPFAALLHLESASRGAEDAGKAERFRRECRAVRDRWGPVLDRDPFYNPAFSRYDHSFLLA